MWSIIVKGSQCYKIDAVEKLWEETHIYNKSDVWKGCVRMIFVLVFFETIFFTILSYCEPYLCVTTKCFVQKYNVEIYGCQL